MTDETKLITPQVADELYMFFMQRVNGWCPERKLALQVLEDLLSKLREEEEPTTENSNESNIDTN